MGAVYRAYDENLDRDVALKVLSTDAVGDPVSRRRFRKEALALARLRHPHIGMVHDFGSDDGVDFLVMELVPGADLATRLEDGPLPEGEVIRLGIQIAEALEEAHENAIVHCDLKPRNIMVTPKGQSKVLDFGLARLVQPQDQVATASVTEAVGVAGTLPYMAPEQLQGHEIDGRTDVYALGVTLCEMATGGRPYEGAAAAPLMVSILKERPRAPREIRESVSEDLERIVLKAIAKDPNDRYQTARELREDLERLRAGEFVIPSVRGRSRVSRAFAAAGVALVVIVTAWGFDLGGLRGLLTGVPDRAVIASIAVLPLTNLSGDPEQEYFADGMHEALITDLARIRALKVIARTSVIRYEESEKPLREIAQELRVDALITGAVFREGERVRITAQLVEPDTEEYLWADSYERDLRNVLSLQSSVVEAIAREVEATLTPEEEARLATSREIDPEAVEHYLKGRHFVNQFTEAGILKGIEHFERAVEIDPRFADAHAGLAYSWHLMFVGHGGPRDKKEACSKARVHAENALKIDEDHAQALAVLGTTYGWCDWDWESAETAIERAVELNPGDASAHWSYGFYLSLLGRHESAIREMRRSLELDPVSPLKSAELGVILAYARRYEEAVDQFKQALELDPDFPPTLGVLALYAYPPLGRHEEAIAAAERAVALTDRNPLWLACLGQVYGFAGKEREARQILEELHDRASHEPLDARYFAWVHAGLGEEERALDWLERGYEEGSIEIPFIARVHYFDGLREHPRFRELLRRVGLPE